MNERIVIRLMQNGQQLPVTSVTNDGVTIGSEDTWPGGLMLEIDGNDAATKFRMDRVRQMNGWESYQFKLDCHTEAGNFIFSGVRANALPFGRYWFRLRIADYLVPGTRFEIEIPENGSSEQVVELQRDRRRFELKGDVATFDPEIVRVLTHAESRIDGLSIPEWLSGGARSRRKACLLNLMAKLRSAPNDSDALIRNTRFVFFADVDRIYAAVDLDYYARLVALAKDSSKPFYAEGSPTDSGHRKLLIRIRKFESSADKFRLRSFRQEGKNSFQSVVAVPPEDMGINSSYADMDIDLGNPLQDVVGFVIHIGELLDPGTTDHLGLYSKLASNPMLSKYLYYRVVADS
jgi:hypothetical protein